MMGTSNDTDRIAALERRIALVEAFLDSELRERQRLSTDEIRTIWRENAAKRKS